jgi:hypothetical protein
MKRASRKLIRDSEETTDQSETAAQFLEDLAAHADNDKEKQRCLTAAKNFRLAAQNNPGGRKRRKEKAEPSRRKPKSSSREQYG